ncbi:uncharacterized protein L201_003765 [Kwoniella dendrophila CBS 6074]|uniref:Pentatricopeptide repeat-containing protein n=1 Tax=Kwoniella dendrophila CBS 6074 TaxID=1295534 RepID=A0AAX4JWC6_9TREE
MPFRARCNPASLTRRQNALLAISNSLVNSAIRLEISKASTSSHTQAYRYNSTSSLFSPFTSFFSRAKGSPVPTPQQAAATFVNSLSTSNTDQLLSSYNTIVQSPAPHELLSRDDLENALSFLSEAKSFTDLNLLRRIFEDFSNRFGHSIRVEHQNLLLKGLCNNGLIEDAFALSQSMNPKDVNWRLILDSATTHNPSMVDLIIPFLRQYSSLTQKDISLILKSLRKSYTSENELETREKLNDILEKVKEQGIILEPLSETELTRLYLSLGDLDKANEIINNWDKTKIRSPGLWNAIIEVYISQNNFGGVEYTIERMRDKGIDPPQKALSFLSIQNLKSNIESKSEISLNDLIGSVENSERICGISASVNVWSDIIKYYLSEVKSQNSLDIAMEVYQEVLSRGLEVSVDLSKNLIIPLCTLRKTSRLNDVIRIYDDYVASSKAFSTRKEKDKISSLYHYLLMACAKSQDLSPSSVTSSYATHTAIRLLNDMSINGITINSTNLISLLVLLIKSSQDHYSAFNLYAHFQALGIKIDEQGYQVILTTYLNLNWDKSPYPPPELFISILKDMNKSGYHNTSSYVLSNLLKVYGHQATKLRRKSSLSSYRTINPYSSSHSSTSAISLPLDENGFEINLEDQLDNLGQSIRDIHTLIKLDPLINVDIPLLSSLMDSYNRLGAYSECFEVWDEIIQRISRLPLTNNHNNNNDIIKENRELYAASINVIFDACGWSYSLKRGKKIWLFLKRKNLIWEKKHYDSYIEFLCRNSQLKDASNFLLDEMGSSPSPSSSSSLSSSSSTSTTSTIDDIPPQPDKESCRIILKFGRREKDKNLNKSINNQTQQYEYDIRYFVQRLKLEKPDLYDQMQEEGELEGIE